MGRMHAAQAIVWLGLVSITAGPLGCDDDSTTTADGAAPVTDAGPDAGPDAAPTDAAPTDAAPLDGEPSDGDVPDAAPDAALAPASCPDAAWQVRDGVFSFGCDGASLTLRPVAIVDGEWLRPDCAADGDGLACTVDGHRLEAGFDGRIFASRFIPGTDVALEALGFEGEAELPGARGWLSNGWQSWSMSGAVAILPEIAEDELQSGVRHIGDREVIRAGRTHSWWYSVTDGRIPLVAGALSADRLKPWVQVTGVDGTYRLRAVAGWAGERITAPAGEPQSGERWWIGLDPDGRAALEAYGAALPRRDGGARAEAGWNSWYELWDAVDAEAVRANAARVGPLLGPAVAEAAPDAPPLRIVIDDGWQLAWGDWRPNDKFPAGLDGLADALKADGFEVGVWMAPLLVDADDPLVAEHPEWFVGDDLHFAHLKHGPMRILDPTHPEAAAHIAGFVRQVVDWGYDFLKIDFLFAGTWEGPRHEAVTGMQAYARAIEVIREAAGEDVVLLAVGAPPVAGFEHLDAWRVGPDIAVENFGASWFFVPNAARAIAARWPFCLAVLCDGDPPILRDLEPGEVEVGLWTAAFAGGAWFLSDDLRLLEDGRDAAAARVGPLTAGLAGVPAVPERMIPPDPPERLSSALSDHLSMRNSHVVPAVWRLPDGQRVRINWGPEEAEVDGVVLPGRSAQRQPAE